MLTESEWKTSKVGLAFLTKTCFTPFEWGNVENILIPTNSKLKVLLAGCGTFLTLSNTVYMFFRIPCTLLRPNASIADMVLHLVCSSWYFTMGLWQYTIGFKRRHEFSQTFNQQAYYNATQGRKHCGSEFEKPKKMRSLIFRASLCMNSTCCIVWAIVFVLQRHQCYWVYSAFPENWKTDTTLILMTCAEVLFSIQWLISCYMVALVQYIYLIGNHFWLNQLCIKWPKVFTSAAVDTPRNLAEILSMYRSLELINRVFNECFASLLIPQFKVLSIFCVVVISYAVIQFGASIHPALLIMLVCCGLISFICLTYICYVGANFEGWTRQFHNNYKDVLGKLPNTHRQYYRKMALACPSFGFRVGSFYTIKKTTVETVLDLLLNAIFFLLVSY